MTRRRDDWPPPINYTVAEVAELLRISETHVYRLCGNGTLRCRRIGRRVIIPIKAVDDFMAGAS